MTLDRRHLLAWFSAALAASGVRVAAGAEPPAAGRSGAAPRSRARTSDASMQLARFVADTQFDALPASVVEMTKRTLLDAIGVSLAASALEPACGAFEEVAQQAGGAGQATLIGSGRKVPMMSAALANGALAHALDFEDSHEASRTHPDAATIAAALAVAEGAGPVSGKELITAIALGCDVVCRLALAQSELPGAAPRTPFYRPAIVGTFGAVTAAAKLLKLTAEQTLSAFSLALCQNSCSGEILNSPDSHIRAVRDGMCAQAGVTSALLAQRGIRGFDRPFEGESGFFAMYWGRGFQHDALLGDLGKRFAMADIAFKPWPSCRDTHLYIQAALELSAREQIDVTRIARIVAPVAERNLIVCEPAATKKAPRTAIDAKFSLYYTVASALVHRKINLASFSAAARDDARVLECAAKVSYRIDPENARPLVEGGGPVLEVVMQDGSVHRQSVRALAGSVQSPMTVPQLVDKFIDCGLQRGDRHSNESLRAVSAKILAADTLPDIAEITRAL